MNINTIYNEDCLETMARLPDNSIPLIVTSPPYDNLRDYNGYTFNFEVIAKELARVLQPGGVIVWIVADQTINGSETLTSCKQKFFFREQLGLKIHDTMIYQKRNFSHPERTRYQNVFEYMFVFAKGKIRTFNPIMDRKNITAGSVGNLGVNMFTMRNGSKSVRSKKRIREFGMRHNVWLGNTRGQEDMCIKLQHPAMMPKWLVRDHILTWSNPGDLVYDPFSGSGTVANMAKELQRNFIASEVSSTYFSQSIQSL